MSAEHVRQSRLAALASRLQRRKEQLERDWRVVQKDHHCAAASLILEARSSIQKAQHALEGKSQRLPSLQCERCGRLHIGEITADAACRECGEPLPARAA